jgi:ankyrin repeat protein
VSGCLSSLYFVYFSLIEHQANLNILDAHSSTPLIIASEFGFTNIVSLLVSNSADLELRDYDGLSAIEAAVRNFQFETFRILVARGAHVPPGLINTCSGPVKFLTLDNKNYLDDLRSFIDSNSSYKGVAVLPCLFFHLDFAIISSYITSLPPHSSSLPVEISLDVLVNLFENYVN